MGFSRTQAISKLELYRMYFLQIIQVYYNELIFFPSTYFRNGIYPLTAFILPQPPTRPRAITPEMTEQEKTETPEPIDIESRRVTNMSCQLRKIDDKEDNLTFHLTLLLRMDDKMNRQLQCDFNSADNAIILAEELVHYGFINEVR